MTESNPSIPNQAEHFRFLESAIEKDLNLKVTILKKAEKGVSSEIYEAKLDNQIVFIKKYKNAEECEVEVLSYDILRKKGLPVPYVVASLEKPPTIGRPVVISSSALGIAIRDSNSPEDRKELIYKDVGELLRKIHEIKLEGFGKPKVVGGKLRGEFSTYEEYRKTEDLKIQKGVEFLLQQGLLNPQQEEKIKKVREDITKLDFGTGSFLHGDLHGNHVFIEEDLITGIIDLGRSRVGDPRYDIAVCLLYTKNEKAKEALLKGYGELANDPIVKKYLIIITIGKIESRFKRTKEIKSELVESLYQLLAEL